MLRLPYTRQWPSRRLTHILAALALLTVLIGPLAGAVHHNCDRTLSDDDNNCSVCLWQHHSAVDLAAAPSLDWSASSRLKPVPALQSAWYLPLPKPAARAPPVASI